MPVCGFCYAKARSPTGRIVMGIAFFLSLAAFILAKSRSGWILGVIVLFLAFGRFRKGYIYVVLIVLAMVLLAEFFIFFYGEHQTGQPVTQEVPFNSPEAEAFRKGEIKDFLHPPGGDLSGGKHFMTQRLTGAKVVLGIIREYLWFGVGPGGYKTYCRSLKESGRLSGYRDTPDNMYLMLAAETGLTGFFLFLAMMSRRFIQLVRKVKTGGEDLRMSKLVLAGMTGLFLHMFFYDMLYWSVSSCCFWILAGFGDGLMARNESRI